MYQVLARTWRPQTFEDLVGQPHVARTLTNSIQTNRLAHAYLFAGLRGTGKTTVARILAKCLNCATGLTTTPCNQCDSCREIAESRSIDVLEIDAASRTKVEQTRELLEMVSYAPARDRYKVLIVDEAHMLSKASFNALLKTLEEPPPRVVFVLATTEMQKVLPTILSRCQVFEFRRVTPAEVAAHLRKIVTSEGIRVSDAALDRIARAGEGSVRDSLSVLERVLAFCGKEAGDDDVMRVLGALHGDILARLIRGLAARDAGAMLAVLDAVLDEGHDLVHFWSELITALRDLLLLASAPDRPDLLARPPGDVATLASAATGLSREDLTRVFHILAELETPLKSSSQPRYLFEATLIRLADLGAVRPIEDVLRTLGGDAGLAPPPLQQKKNHAEPPVTAAAPAIAGARPGRDAVLAALQAARPMLGAMLEQASVLELGEQQLRVGFPPEMDALKRQLLRSDNLSQLRRSAEELAGRPITVLIETAGLDGSGGPPAAEDAEPAGPGLLERARSEPGIQELLQVFGAQVVEIHPLSTPEPSAGEGSDSPGR